ncbi:MAG: asparagine synthase C-terminal domain-containing protein [Candidatus Methanomethylophilaceae archaeon]
MWDGLTTALDAAVESMVSGKDVAVAFSGGLDSGIIAALTKRYARSAKLYTVGAEGSYDVAAAKEMAALLGMEWEHIVMDEENLEAGLRDAISVTGTVDPVVLSFEVPLMYILPYIGEPAVIGGQGADEIFYGYSKYLGLSEDELRAAASEDMDRLENVTRVHESRMAERYGKEILYPYLDEGVMEEVSGIPFGTIRPTEDGRKMPLRDCARQLGYPEIADKPKKAAQYGTGAMNMMKRMAKARSMTVGEYILSLKDGGSSE